MSVISFFRADTQEVIGTAPLADWWKIAGELFGTITSMKDEATRTKLLALTKLGSDFRQPPRQIILTELDLVDWHWACSIGMIRVMKQVADDSDAYLKSPHQASINLSQTWAHKISGAFVELLALNMALLDAHCQIEVREVRTPMLKVI